MAETATKTTTPRRRRAATTTKTSTATAPTATKPPAVKREAKKPATSEVTFELAHLATTKGREHFDQSLDVSGNDTGCVGKFYAPPGTVAVRVTLVGPADIIAEIDAGDEE